MNRGRVFAQANQVLANDVMNPRQQQKWMDKPAGDPSDLACLRPLNSFVVKQVVSLYEMLAGVAGAAKFGIFNDRGEQVYYAHEESDMCERACCTRARKFDIHVTDQMSKEVMLIKHEFKCCVGTTCLACCTGCQQEITVEAPAGNLIGYVTQECSCWYMHYVLRDANGNDVLKIISPGCVCDGPMGCCCENKFTLVGTDDSEIGAIKKKYRGYVAEALTSADTYSVEVPINLDVRMKAVALAAVMLIDFVHFSTPPQERRRGRGRTQY